MTPPNNNKTLLRMKLTLRKLEHREKERKREREGGLERERKREKRFQ